MSSLFRIAGVQFFVTPSVTRVPFRFGAVTLRAAVTCLARVEVLDGDGRRFVGHSADLCVPKWFEKNPATTPAQDVRALQDSALAAGSSLLEGAPAENQVEATVFDHWLRVYNDRVGSVAYDAPDRMVRGFGVALCERALIDAACRAMNVSFDRAIRDGLLGFRPDALHPQLAGFDLCSVLPSAPREEVLMRHTIGMLDALEVDTLPAADRLEDGLPQSLDEDIRRYGLRCFKIKVGAGPGPDFDRLTSIASVLQRECDGRGPVSLTLDGNEQYPDFSTLADLLQRLRGDERGRYVLDALMYVEQPLARTMTLDPSTGSGIARVAEYAPVIIDEADSGHDSFERAHAIGYRGISVKNCKGVFRALMHRGLCAAWDDGSFLAAEDLTNLGVLALQQDLATIATLGLEHAERNGHHYFRGLGHLPDSEVAAALATHSDLYVSLDAAGAATVRIEGGVIRTGSVQCVGYGYAVPIDTSSRDLLEPGSTP